MSVLDIAKRVNRLSNDWANQFEPDQPTVASGFGVWLLLATLLIGAEDDARTELESVTGILQNEASTAISSLMDAVEAVDGLKLAIAVWLHDSIELLPEFIAKSPKVSIRAIAESQEILDAWAAEKTDHLIEKFPLEIAPDSLLILASALVAKGTWKKVFREQAGMLTTAFRNLNIAAVIYHEETAISRIIVEADNGLDVYLLAGSETDSPSAVVTAGLSELLGTAKVINGDQLKDGDQAGCLKASLYHSEASKIHLRLPQFEISSTHDLLRSPETFALKSACDKSRGHFPGISEFPLAVDQAAQNAMMSFGPKGFEAAAVTAISLLAGGCGTVEQNEKKLQLIATFDRSFGFIVVESESKLALFTGWVTESAFVVEK